MNVLRTAAFLLVLGLLPVQTSPVWAQAHGLGDALSRKNAVKCQKALLGAAADFFKTELSILAKCNAKALDCVNAPKPEAKSACLQKGNACRKALQSTLTNADSELGSQIADACGPLTTDDLLGPTGLGFEVVDVECGSVLVDGSSIAGCLRKVYRRSIERLFAIESPRTRELFKVTGIDLASLPDLPGYPSCDGCSLVEGDTTKTLTKCAKSITSAGQTYAATAAKLVSKCALALFGCEQSVKPLSQIDLDLCRAKAQVKCQDVKNKAVLAQGKVRAKVTTACDAVPFATLKSQAGANIETLVCECSAVNVESLPNLDRYLECSRLHHECRVAQLLRFAAPRLDELLSRTASTKNLEDILCAIPSDAATLEASSRALSGCKICRFLRGILGRFKRGGGFGTITKYATLKLGGAKRAAWPRGSSAPPATIVSITGDRTYAPNRSRQITVGYQLSPAALAAARAGEPPKLLIAVERLDGSLVANDAFELELEPTINETDMTVSFPPEVPGESGCSFRLVFGIGNGDDTEFVPVDLTAGTCTPNGKLETGEDCDDGNPFNGDACDNNCTVPHCGNGIVAGGEQCDDGNVEGNDGCPFDCGVVSDSTPTPTVAPRTATPTPTRSPTPSVSTTAIATRTLTPSATDTPTATPGTPTPTFGTPGPTATPILVRISLSPVQTTRSFGEFQRYTATGHYSDDSLGNLTQKVVYSSSDLSVAFPSNMDGDRSRVECVGTGVATITATDPISGISSNDSGESAVLEVMP